jgi:hypothetical protein
MQNISKRLIVAIIVIIAFLGIGWLILFGIGIRYFGLTGGAKMASDSAMAVLHAPYESLQYVKNNGLDGWKKQQQERDERKDWLDYDFRNCSSQNIGEYFSGGWDVTMTSNYPDLSRDEFPLVTNPHEVEYIVRECFKNSHEEPLSKSHLLSILDDRIEKTRHNEGMNKIYRTKSLPRLESIRRILEAN